MSASIGLVFLHAREPSKAALQRAEDCAAAGYEVHIVIDKITREDLDSLQADHPTVGLHTLYSQVSIAFGYWDLAYLDRGNLFAQLNMNPCAWDKALCLDYLEGWSSRLSALWFIEDDVAIKGRVAALQQLDATYTGVDLVVQRHDTVSADHAWVWWRTCAADFQSQDLAHSLVPVCRVSSRLLALAHAFAKKHHKLTLHECLFSSLAQQHGLGVGTPDEFATIRWHTNVNMAEVEAAADGAFLHPAKDEEVREAAWAWR